MPSKQLSFLPNSIQIAVIDSNGTLVPPNEDHLHELCNANGLTVLKRGDYLCRSCGCVRHQDKPCRFCEAGVGAPERDDSRDLKHCGTCGTILYKDAEGCHFCELQEKYDTVRANGFSSTNKQALKVALLSIVRKATEVLEEL